MLEVLMNLLMLVGILVLVGIAFILALGILALILKVICIFID